MLIKHNEVLVKGTTINQYRVSFIHCHFLNISHIYMVCVITVTIMKEILEPMLTIKKKTSAQCAAAAKKSQ